MIISKLLIQTLFLIGNQNLYGMKRYVICTLCVGTLWCVWAHSDVWWYNMLYESVPTHRHSCLDYATHHLCCISLKNDLHSKDGYYNYAVSLVFARGAIIGWNSKPPYQFPIKFTTHKVVKPPFPERENSPIGSQYMPTKSVLYNNAMP